MLLILFDSLFHVFSLNIHIILPINRTKWWIIKVKHPSSDIYRKNISLMKINNIILVLRTRIILLSSFVIYFFCICHSGRFPINLLMYWSLASVSCLSCGYSLHQFFNMLGLVCILFRCVVGTSHTSTQINWNENTTTSEKELWSFSLPPKRWEARTSARHSWTNFKQNLLSNMRTLSNTTSLKTSLQQLVHLLSCSR